MKKIFLLICLMLTLLVNGCASIMCGDDKIINVKSNPPKAKFTIKDRKGNAVHQGTTPANVILKRGDGWFQKANYEITFEKKNCVIKTLLISQEWETGWYLGGNFLFGGLIGIVIVDPLTGAMWTIEDVNAQLLCIEDKKSPINKERKLIGYRAITEYPSGRIITTPVYEGTE